MIYFGAHCEKLNVTVERLIFSHLKMSSESDQPQNVCNLGMREELAAAKETLAKK